MNGPWRFFMFIDSYYIVIVKHGTTTCAFSVGIYYRDTKPWFCNTVKPGYNATQYSVKCRITPILKKNRFVSLFIFVKITLLHCYFRTMQIQFLIYHQNRLCSGDSLWVCILWACVESKWHLLFFWYLQLFLSMHWLYLVIKCVTLWNHIHKWEPVFL